MEGDLITEMVLWELPGKVASSQHTDLEISPAMSHSRSIDKR